MLLNKKTTNIRLIVSYLLRYLCYCIVVFLASKALIELSIFQLIIVFLSLFYFLFFSFNRSYRGDQLLLFFIIGRRFIMWNVCCPIICISSLNRTLDIRTNGLSFYGLFRGNIMVNICVYIYVDFS